jgi:F-type H+-transporting ATPase subunit alpha
MDAAVTDFKKQFKSSVAPALNEAAADALDSEAAEAITKHVPPAVKK